MSETQHAILVEALPCARCQRDVRVEQGQVLAGVIVTNAGRAIQASLCATCGKEAWVQVMEWLENSSPLAEPGA